MDELMKLDIAGLSMDEVVKKISGLGLSGVSLIIAIVTSGGNSAAVMASLGLLGGPLGIVGGLGLLSMIGIFGEAIGQFGFESILTGTYAERSKTESTQALLKEIKELPISEGLKVKLKQSLHLDTTPDPEVPQEPVTVVVVEE
jgi:hypothetical protein